MKNADLGFKEAIRYATISNPTTAVTSTDTEFEQYGGYFELKNFDYYNPVSIIEQNTNESKNKHSLINMKASYELLKGLNMSSSYSQQRESSLRAIYISKTSFWPLDLGLGQGRAHRTTEDRFNHLFETTVNYKKELDKSSLNILGGYTYQEFINEGFLVEGQDFLTDLNTFNSFQSSLGIKSGLSDIQSHKESNKLVAFFGRASFNHDDTYHASISARYEGSSRLGANNKWEIFPSVSTGLTLSNLFDISGIGFLKLRAGFGITGNDAPESYLSLFLFEPSYNHYYHNGVYKPNYTPASNPNPDLKPETKTDFSVGIDFSSSDNKLSGTFDFYTSQTKDLIFNTNVSVPPNHYRQTWANVGTLKNSGLELALNYLAIETKKTSYELNLAVSYFFDTKFETLPQDGFDLEGFRVFGSFGFCGASPRLEEGAPVGQIIALTVDGKNPINNDNQWNFKDVNGDNLINDHDREIAGSGLPNLEIGWANTFTVGKIDARFLFRGVFGHDLVNVNRANYESPAAIYSYNVLSGTRDLSKLTDIPTLSSYHIENAAFVKLDNITLGYSLRLAKDAAFSKVRLYVTAQNLFTITGYKGTDPEVRYADTGFSGNEYNVLLPGIDRRNTYFSTRSYSFGINLGF